MSDPLTQLTPSAVTWIGAALTPPELSSNHVLGVTLVGVIPETGLKGRGRAAWCHYVPGAHSADLDRISGPRSEGRTVMMSIVDNVSVSITVGTATANVPARGPARLSQPQDGRRSATVSLQLPASPDLGCVRAGETRLPPLSHVDNPACSSVAG